MRKLATIQRITNLSPIPGADVIERADVLGWSVVVKKGEFQVGDLAVYHEIDSFLPASEPAYAFLMDKPVEYNGNLGARLKTTKRRKQLSQGLLMPINAFAGLEPDDEWAEGMDVSELLSIEKWEPPEERRSNSGGINKPAGTKGFPSFLRKTDQERVQNYINELGRHSDETFEVSVKLDGSSMTVFYVDKSSKHYGHIVEDQEKRMLRNMGWREKMVWKVRKFFGWLVMPEGFSGVCSRNLQLDVDGDNHFSKYYRDHGFGDKLREGLAKWQLSYAIQGELIGPSIQENHEKVTENEFYVFDIFDIDKQEYLLPEQVRDTCMLLGLKTVPVLDTDLYLVAFGETSRLDWSDQVATRKLVDSILAYAEGPGMNPGVKREGIVFKSNSTSFSFKAISNSYLLKKEGK